MKRGDLFWADISPRSGSEQSGKRPVIIMSHNAFNQTAGWRSIIVIPISTSEKQARRGPTTVLVSALSTGLSRDSIALCHQVTTVDRSKLMQKIGTLPPGLLQEIERGLMTAVGIMMI